jgi:23S rRNA pseudouridine1911/1915/1917 synthase
VDDLTVVVPAALDGVRIDRVVALVCDLPRSVVGALVADGRVRLGGDVVVEGSRTVRTGERLGVDRSGVIEHPELVAEGGVEFAVVVADESVVVVDKPAGLVVHPGAGHPGGTLANGLVARFPDLAARAQAGTMGDPLRPGIVHRLDRGTSGLLVVARTPEAYRSLSAQLATRTVSRVYQALVAGTVGPDEGLVDAPVGRSRSSPTRMAVVQRGKEARTRYRVVRRFGAPSPVSLVEATLETGRTHQIRVHLAAIGHPVVGDLVYGRPSPGGAPAPGRPFLHAGSLSFNHPASGERQSYRSELPDDLLTVLGGYRT